MRRKMTTQIVIEEQFLKPLAGKKDEAAIKGIVCHMLAFAKDLIVDSEETYKGITSLYRSAREWKKAIDAYRQELVAPLRNQMSVINDRAKELTDPLDKVIDIANAKTAEYHKILAETKRLEDEKIRAAAAIFDAQDEIYIPPMEKTLRGAGAISVTKTVKRFKIEDLKKVPLKYLMINEDIVNQDIKLGVAEISGISIYEETTTQLRTR